MPTTPVECGRRLSPLFAIGDTLRLAPARLMRKAGLRTPASAEHRKRALRGTSHAALWSLTTTRNCENYQVKTGVKHN